MSKPAVSALYFTLTFIAGAAVGSWALWIYLMGFPSAQEGAPPAPPPAAIAAPAPSPLPSPPPRVDARDEASGEPAEPAVPAEEPEAAEPTPTPKGHWNTVDVAGRSHEECLALHKELNDAYKDCRFGVHKKEWIPE